MKKNAKRQLYQVTKSVYIDESGNIYEEKNVSKKQKKNALKKKAVRIYFSRNENELKERICCFIFENQKFAFHDGNTFSIVRDLSVLNELHEKIKTEVF